MTGLSYRELAVEILENLNMEAFCGFRSTAAGDGLDSSALAKIRKIYGTSFFRHVVEITYEVFIKRGLIRKRGTGSKARS